MIAGTKLYKALYYLHNRHTLPSRLRKVREKEVIDVAFIVYNLSKWKTEELYLAMERHPRFNPVVVCTLPAISKWVSSRVAANQFVQLTEYLDKKKYNYCEAVDHAGYKADIIFYQEPHEHMVAEGLEFQHTDRLAAYVPYFDSSTSSNNTGSIKTWLTINCAFFFVDNDWMLNKIRDNEGHTHINAYATGLPFSDRLRRQASDFNDPWKPQPKRKKCIIWAPHFTIHEGLSFLNVSSFTEMHEWMPEIARKYADDVQFAFKPHPGLYKVLCDEWGTEKADSYYKMWDSMPNTQLCEGEYIGLFKYSDAIIHDSQSFVIEYLHIDKPAMYTQRSDDSLCGEIMLKGFEVYQRGNSRDEVESFIQNVIAGIDPKAGQRAEFREQFLMPPGGKTACDNIIGAILGDH